MGNNEKKRGHRAAETQERPGTNVNVEDYSFLRSEGFFQGRVSPSTKQCSEQLQKLPDDKAKCSSRGSGEKERREGVHVLDLLHHPKRRGEKLHLLELLHTPKSGGEGLA